MRALLTYTDARRPRRRAHVELNISCFSPQWRAFLIRGELVAAAVGPTLEGVDEAYRATSNGSQAKVRVLKPRQQHLVTIPMENAGSEEDFVEEEGEEELRVVPHLRDISKTRRCGIRLLHLR